MAVKVTQEEIIQINEVYATCHNYTQTSKIVGRSPSTVKKYIIPNYISIKNKNNSNEPPIEFLPIESVINFLHNNKNITLLSNEEKEELKGLWEELII